MKLLTRLFLLMSIGLVCNNSVQGQQTFLKIYGPQSSWGQRAISTFDGGYISCGHIFIPGQGDFDVKITRTDSLGNQIWQKDYHGDSLEYSWDIIANEDSTYTFLTTGYGPIFGDYNEVQITNIDDAGNVNWNKSYTIGGRIGINSIVHTLDGGYMIGGWSEQRTPFINPYFMKTNSKGDTLWTKNYGRGTQGQFNYVVQTQDSGYIGVGAVTRPSASDNDIAVIRTNKNGDTVWTKYYGDLNDQGAMKCYLESDGSLVLAGGGSNGTDFEGFIWKLNASGDTIWKTREAIPGRQIQFTGICKTYNGGYYATGIQADVSNSKSICLATHFDANGTRTWRQTWDVIPPIQGPGHIYSELYGLSGTPDGGGIACGWATNGAGEELILLKLYSNWVVGIESQPTLVSIQPRPNPMATQSNFLIPSSMTPYDFELTTISGQTVVRETRLTSTEFALRKEDLAPGVYIYTFAGNEIFATGKLVVR